MSYLRNKKKAEVHGVEYAVQRLKKGEVEIMGLGQNKRVLEVTGDICVLQSVTGSQWNINKAVRNDLT